MQSFFIASGVNMGGIRRIKKGMQTPVALGETGVKFHGCRVLLVDINHNKVKESVGAFPKFLAHLSSRAGKVNLGDLYEAHFKVLSCLEKGKLWN